MPTETTNGVLPPPNLRDVAAKRMQAAQTTQALVLTYDEAVRLLNEVDEAHAETERWRKRSGLRLRRGKVLEAELSAVTAQRDSAEREVERMNEEYRKQADVVADRGAEIEEWKAEVIILRKDLQDSERDLSQARKDLEKANEQAAFFAGRATRKARKQDERKVRASS